MQPQVLLFIPLLLQPMDVMVPPVVVTVTVNPLTRPTVTIFANPGVNICAGTQVTFGANIGNYGVTPIYDWRLNGVAVGTGSTYTSNTLANGNVITLRVTADATTICPATTISNAITMTVNPSVTPNRYNHRTINSCLSGIK